MSNGSLSQLARLARKEMREILRDRRTIITLVLMPLLLYPLLGIGFRFFLTSLVPSTNAQYRIAVHTKEEQEALNHLLFEFNEAKPDEPKVFSLPSENIEESLRNEDADIGIELKGLEKGRSELDPRQTIECLILRTDDSPQGMHAEDFVVDRLKLTNIRILQKRLGRFARISEPALPVQIETRLIKTREGQKGSYLASLIPLVLVLMTITGAVYPSIDLTAGERERGTLEILMAAPVSRVRLLLAKYAAVMTVAMLTGIINLTMMTLTIAVSGMQKQLFPEGGLSIVTILSVLALLLLFAAFFSAVLLAVTSFARSFKEAQAYLIPLMLLAISPGLISLMPGVNLEQPKLMPIVPLINVVLLTRDILEGGTSLGAGAVVVLSTMLYAFSAIGIAARLFGAEAVLYSEQGQFSDLFRRPARSRPVASLNGAILSVAIAFPLSVLAGSGLGQLPMSPATLLVISMIASIAMFVGVPAIAASFGNIRIQSGFALRNPPVFCLLGAAILGVSLWPVVAQLIVWQEQAGFSTMPQILRDRLHELADQRRDLPHILVLLSFAIVPAVVEELFFRGWLFSALEKRMHPWNAILLSALLFGMFHIITGGILLAERLLPTTLLGVVLGWVRWRSGSVWPGIVLHMLHNGLLVSAGLYPETFGQMNKAVEGTGYVPLTWLTGGIAVAAIGAALVWLGKPSIRESSADAAGLLH
jgi:ABC-2 type transport system permease protein/sodium transport system permease protein